MNDLGKKSTIQYLAAGFAGFAAILAVGSLVSMIHGGSRSAKVAFSARPRSSAMATRPNDGAVRSAASTPAPAASPLPVLPADAARGEAAVAAAAPAGAAAASAPSASPARLAAGAHVDMSGSASSSASASASSPAAKNERAAAAKPAPVAKRFLAKDADAAVASTIHYGVSGRSELMGRAAGPVYNFSGGAAKSGGQVAADNAAAAGALQQVDAAEKQIDSSDMTDEQKAQLHRQIEQARSAAAPAAGSTAP